MFNETAEPVILLEDIDLLEKCKNNTMTWQEKKLQLEQHYLHSSAYDIHLRFSSALNEIKDYFLPLLSDMQVAPPTIFVSFAYAFRAEDGRNAEDWVLKSVKYLVRDLKAAGFLVYCCEEIYNKLAPTLGGNIIHFMRDGVENSDHMLIVGTPIFRYKCIHQKGSDGTYAVRQEWLDASTKHQRRNANDRPFILPSLLVGTRETSLSHLDPSEDTLYFVRNDAPDGIDYSYINCIERLVLLVYNYCFLKYKKSFTEQHITYCEKIWKHFGLSCEDTLTRHFMQRLRQGFSKAEVDGMLEQGQVTDEGAKRYFRQKMATLQISPSPVAIQEAKDIIRSVYARYARLKPLFGETLSLEEQQSVVLKMRYQAKKEGLPYQAENLVQAEPQFYQAFIEITIDQFFLPSGEVLKEKLLHVEENSDQALKILLIQGAAGSGKTACINRIASEWAEGKLWSNYPWVFLLRCRDLRSQQFLSAYEKEQQYSLEDWIYHALYKGKMSEKDFRFVWENEIKPYLKESLLILDGYDEVPDHHVCERALEDLLDGGDVPLMITSRSYGVEALPKHRRHIHLVGFDDENIRQYIKRFYINQGQKKSDAILDALPNYPILWTNAHVPVLLNIICGLLDKVQISETLTTVLAELNSMGVLYERMEMALLERAIYLDPAVDNVQFKHASVERKETLVQSHYDKTREISACLAFSSLCQQELLMSASFVEKVLTKLGISMCDQSEVIDRLLALGFLRPTMDTEGLHCIGYEFCHLSFHEYYAAQHIVKIIKNKDLGQLAVLQNFKWDPRYQLVWRFVSGLLRNDPIAWCRFIAFLQETSNEELIGHYQLALLITCLDEARETATTSGVLADVEKAVKARLIGLFHLYQNNQLPESFHSVLLDTLKESPYWLKTDAFIESLVGESSLPWSDWEAFLTGYDEQFAFHERRQMSDSGSHHDIKAMFDRATPSYLNEKEPLDRGREYYIKAWVHRFKGQMREALASFYRSAEQGFPLAYIVLALIAHGELRRMWTVEKSEEEAQHWLSRIAPEHLVWLKTKAAERYAGAQVMLGLMLECGVLFDEDKPGAVSWYRQAVEQHDAIAANTLGFAYESGMGVEENRTQAVQLYLKSAEQGYAIAQNNLGFSYEKGKGIEKDAAQAMKWYLSAAEQGYAWAQYNLGRLYWDGAFVDKNEEYAVAWFSKAAQQGVIAAQKMLAVCYQQGIRLETHAEEARILNERLDQQLGEKARVADLVHLVKGVDAGRKAWYYVLPDREKLHEFLLALNDPIIHLEHYGEVLYSAYGDAPPLDITNKVEKEYEIGQTFDRRAILDLGDTVSLEEKHQKVLMGLRSERLRLRRAAIDTVTDMSIDAITPEILVCLIGFIRNNDSLAYRATSILGRLGAMVVTPEVIALLVVDINVHVLAFIQFLTGRHFNTLLQCREQVMMVWPVLIMGAFFSREIHFNIRWCQEERRYELKGFSGKSPFCFGLGLQEVQLLRHLMPKILDHLHQGNFDQLIALFDHPNFPLPKEDGLLWEHCALLSSGNSTSVSANRVSEHPNGFFLSNIEPFQIEKTDMRRKCCACVLM